MQVGLPSDDQNNIKVANHRSEPTEPVWLLDNLDDIIVYTSQSGWPQWPPMAALIPQWNRRRRRSRPWSRRRRSAFGSPFVYLLIFFLLIRFGFW